jgi:hypothetical protein
MNTLTAAWSFARSKAVSAFVEIANRLNDSDPDVRFQAVDALRQLTPYPGRIST